MRLVIAAIGRLKAGPERELADRYRERAAKAGRPLGFRSVDVFEIAESRAARVEDRMVEEAAALAKHGADDDVVSSGRRDASRNLLLSLAPWRLGELGGKQRRRSRKTACRERELRHQVLLAGRFFQS